MSQTWTYLFEVLLLLISFREAPRNIYFSILWYIFVYLVEAKVLHIWFITWLAYLWLPLSRMNAMYSYYKNMFKWFVRYRFVFDHLVRNVLSIYAAFNTQQRTTTPFSSWSPLSRFSLLWWSYKNTVLRFMWYRLVFIQLIKKFISVYPASTHRDEQHHHLKSITS